MRRDGAVERLAWILGIVFVGCGIAESIRVVVSGDGGLAFWFLSLCGGGALILLGSFVVKGRPWLSFTLVAIGCLVAGNATVWTLVLPVLALALLVLTFHRSREAAKSASA